jgi:arginine exporter protein ArgO
MIGQSNAPLWKRASMRAALVAVSLFASIEVLRLFGRAEHIDRGEALVIAAGGAAVYSALWFVTAAWTARLLKKIEDAAKDQDK